MNDQILSAFLSRAKKVSVKKKTLVVPPGLPNDKLFYLIEGIAVITGIDPFGGSVTFERIFDDRFFGEEHFLATNSVNDLGLRTKVECEFAVMTYSAVSEFTLEYPEFREILIQSALSRSARDRKHVSQLANLDVVGRLGFVLLDLTKHPDSRNCPEGVKISLTQEELGDLVGSCREMVARVLDLFEENGLITREHRSILIVGH